MRAAVALACAALVAGPAGAQAAGASSPNPSFAVSVVSTYVRRHVTQIAAKPQANGCFLETDADAAQLVTTKTIRPVVLSLKQLEHGVGRFAQLAARETRGGHFYYGYQPGCPYLATNPPHVGDTSGCGKGSFSIIPEDVTLGYFRGTKRFTFTYQWAGGDPFHDACLPEVFVGEDERLPGSAIVDLPPQRWLAGPAARPWWTTLDPARLRRGKNVVVRFKDTATFAIPGIVADPSAYDKVVDTDTYTIAWTVTLVPVKP